MINHSLRWAVVVWTCLAGSAWAQFKEGAAGQQEIKRGETVVQKWQCGVSMSAGDNPCMRLVATIPVPVDWPEQEVRVAEEDITPAARVTYQMLEGVKQMTVTISRLPAGQEAHAIVTMEVRRSAIEPPEKTDNLKLPDPARLEIGVRPYLGPSPLIETRSPKITALAKKIAPDQTKAWAKVEAIYDWVRENVKFKEKLPLRGALAALNAGEGGCDDVTAVFIALCRVNDIPARTVHVYNHCYPEFYLVDDKAVGHWFPCEVAKGRLFGGTVETRPILEKGDNFRDPRNPKEHHHFLPETVTGAGGRPTVDFIRELLPN